MEVYFEKITLANVGSALFSRAIGQQVFYFELGRLFRRIPGLSRMAVSLFPKVQYQISETPGLCYEIHGTALRAAEVLYQRTAAQNSRALGLWRNTFKSDKVDLYIKKMVSLEAWPPIKNYLVLLNWVRNGHPPLRLVVLDSPLNHELLPFLQNAYPEPGIRIGGLSRIPWRYVQRLINIALPTAEVLARLPAFIWRQGVVLRRKKIHYKMSKELIWGIGVRTGSRNDDFVVDGELIQPGDIILYHRRESAARMGRSEFLKASIANAADRGYRCVDFDRTPVPLALIWSVVLPRYIAFPIVIAALAFVGHGGLLNHIVSAFLVQTRGWEVFLASYAPKLNLSQDDPQASHIATTIALNLHGLKNGGFQWSDLTTYRAVTLAYLGYDVYFSWGGIVEKYWKGNWGVDRVVRTGYLWGHRYQECLNQRALLIPKLIGSEQEPRHVISLFDETPYPDVYQSEGMLYDFYRIATSLLDRRSDTVVVAKPKRLEATLEVSTVSELIAPYVESGRLVILNGMNVDLWQVLAVSDVAVSMVMGTPHLEAVCCGKTGFSFAPTRNLDSPIYAQGYGKVVFDEVDDLVNAIDRALDHPEENPWAGLEGLINDIDPYRDSRGVDRMRRFISDMSPVTPPLREVEAVGVTGSG